MKTDKNYSGVMNYKLQYISPELQDLMNGVTSKRADLTRWQKIKIYLGFMQEPDRVKVNKMKKPIKINFLGNDEEIEPTINDELICIKVEEKQYAKLITLQRKEDWELNNTMCNKCNRSKRLCVCNPTGKTWKATKEEIKTHHEEEYMSGVL